MKYLLLLIIFIFVGCASRHRDYCKDTTIEECRQARDRYYCAIMRFLENNDINEILYIFDDSTPVVGLKSVNTKEAYRLLLSRSFYSSVLVTVVVNRDNAELNLRVTENTGCFLQALIRNKTTRLTKQQLEQLRNVVQANRFWEGKLSDARGYDGTEWIIEIKQQGVYHFGKEWSPDQGAIFNIGRCLLEMGQYGLEEDPCCTAEEGDN